MKCLVTICSKSKDESNNPLPAHLRYTAPHISQTYQKAKELNLPLYILSGKFGLVSGEELVPLYDYYLEKEKVEELSTTIAEQIKLFGITDIIFYVEDKETWKPYISALEKATQKSECVLHQENISQIPLEIKTK